MATLFGMVMLSHQVGGFLGAWVGGVAFEATVEAGRGGALMPLMCVDKPAADCPGFASIAADADRSGNAWSLLFAAAIGHRNGVAPTPAQVQAALQQMIEAIGAGKPQGFALFDREGQPVQAG